MSGQAMVPVIPESAPFTPAQRAWLNGFLAGLYSQGEVNAQAGTAAATRDVAVLYASQTGTSERLAKKIAKELKAKGHTARIASLEGYAPAALATEECALILASTYGEGDPPDVAQGFFAQLCDEGAPRMDKLSYSVLALGDSHYEHFCKFGVDLHERLASLGAKALHPIVTCDVEVDEPFEQWKSGLMARLAEAGMGATNGASSNGTAHLDGAVKTAEPASQFHRDNPFAAALVDKRALTHDTSSKQTLHLAFSLAGSDLVYEAGDALGVVAANNPALVTEILDQAKLDAGESVTLPKVGTCNVVEALTQHLQITRLSRKLVEAYAKAGNCEILLGLLKPEQQTHLDTYMYDRGLIDLLVEYPGVIGSAQQMCEMLAKLAPRLYSISSSPKAHAGEVHATVAVVRYRSHNRERGGVCSTLFADRLDQGATMPVYIQANKKFRLPADGAAPIVMIGPGTGIAPFRAFLHERAATGATGKNWLFFGAQSVKTDYLYEEELAQMQASGVLTRLDTAFSRDQDHKIYVQDRMVEQGAELFGWLEQGATVYVCGDASRMAKDVDAALHTVIEKHGSRDAEAAKEYVAGLHDTKRYLKDVY
jgi:sulfite reductase (NADPH) flavoprotein alpha-component